VNQPDVEIFRHKMSRIDELAETLEEVADPAAREAARELVRTLLELHGAGLRKMLDHIGRADQAGQVFQTFADDPLVSNLLKLHSLHPVDLYARLLQALDSLRPVLRAHAVEVDLLTASVEAIRLRLRGGVAPWSELKALLEDAVRSAVPEVAVLEIEEASRPPAPPDSRRHSLPMVGGALP
jgi:hypothetical protein